MKKGEIKLYEKKEKKKAKKSKKEVVDEPWNNSEFNRNTTFWHQNKKKESQKKCQKRKKEKTKRRPKRDWTGGFVGAVFGKPDGHAVA